MRLAKPKANQPLCSDAEGQTRPATRSLRGALKQLLPDPARRGLERAWVRGQIKAASLLGDPGQLRRPVTAHQCPICGYEGRFWSFGELPRAEALCPQCFSLERHRLFQLLLDRG